MISEVDLRDWEKVDFSLIKAAERADNNRESADLLYIFAEQVNLLRERQMRAVQKQLPALLKGKE